MIGDFIISIGPFFKSTYQDAKRMLRENFCLHDYEIKFSSAGVNEYKCKKGGRVKYE